MVEDPKSGRDNRPAHLLPVSAYFREVDRLLFPGTASRVLEWWLMFMSGEQCEWDRAAEAVNLAARSYQSQ